MKEWEQQYHPDYLQHICSSFKEVKKSKFYNGEMIYKMHKATQWYLTMVTEWAQSFNTPIDFCPYCGNKLTSMSTETS